MNIGCFVSHFFVFKSSRFQTSIQKMFDPFWAALLAFVGGRAIVPAGQTLEFFISSFTTLTVFFSYKFLNTLEQIMNKTLKYMPRIIDCLKNSPWVVFRNY